MGTKYSIVMAEKLSGVGAHTLRAWEKRYGAIVPMRDSAGHREYTKQDIKKLILLKDLCEHGYLISKIASKDEEELTQILADLNTKPGSLKFNVTKNDDDIKKRLLILLLALRNYNLEVVAIEVEKLTQVLNPREFVFEVIRPIMAELGHVVAIGEFSISQEHALSAILKFSIGHYLYKKNYQNKKNSGKIAIFSIEGDHHEFGILMASLLAAFYKLEFHYLGASLPINAALDAVKFLNIKSIIIGSTQIVKYLDQTQIVKELNNLISRIPATTELIIGGELTNLADKLNSKNITFINTIEDLDIYFSNL
jgi:DNA-binding transcriptional MerR regulator